MQNATSEIVLTPRQVENFWKKVNKTDSCWLWTAGKNEYGYGHFAVRPGPMRRSHRIAWVLANGPIETGTYVCHKCDVPACVNPQHLFLGTHMDNMRDKVAKCRGSRGEHRPASVLTETIVIEMRRRELAGESAGSLAREFGVHQVTASNAIKARTWKHVPSASLTSNGEQISLR